MKDHGLLFSAPMIRARAAGLKTQTRRIISKQNSSIDGHGSRMPYSNRTWEEFDFNDAYVDPGPSPAGNAGPYLKVALDWAGKDRSRHRFYPRIQPGHRIWWKETHKLMTTDSLHYYPELNDGRPTEEEDPRESEFHITIPIYRATDPDIELVLEDDDDDSKPVPWSPSLLMPRKWARYVDQVIAVRPERLQDISREDAAAEGVCIADAKDHFPGYRTTNWPEQNYRALWEHINGPGSWALNPWVWVYTMRHTPAAVIPAKAGISTNVAVV